ncbi:MAG: CoA-binding protein [Peptostreptococcaceae bacterium]
MSLLRFNSWAILIKGTKIDTKELEIIEELKNQKCKVVGINENRIDVEGIQIYESLKDVPHNIDVVVVVDESVQTYLILEEMELLDINNIWFEKDCNNENTLKRAREMKMNIEYKFSLCKELNK